MRNFDDDEDELGDVDDILKDPDMPLIDDEKLLEEMSIDELDFNDSGPIKVPEGTSEDIDEEEEKADEEDDYLTV